MSFFKKIVSKIKNSMPSGKEVKNTEDTQKEIVKINDIDTFWREFNLIRAQSSPEEMYKKIRELVSGLDEDIKKQIHRVIRSRLYGIDVEESENREFVKNFVNFRIKLYNPIFKESQDTRLAKLILTVISRYPDAVKSKKISVGNNTSIFNKDDLEIQKLSSEYLSLSIKPS